MCIPSPTPSLQLINIFLREIQRGKLPDVSSLQETHFPARERGSSTQFGLEAFLSSSNKHGDTALLVAAREGHVGLLEVLHQQHGVPLEQRNADGKTALHEAAQGGQLQCVQYLLREGATVDALKRADWWVWLCMY